MNSNKKLLKKVFFRVIFLILLCLYICYLKRAFGDVQIDSDYSTFVLEANEIIHGNFFLNDWHLTGVSFITAELPYYMLTTSLFGISIKSYVYANIIMFLMFLVACYMLMRNEIMGDWFTMLIASAMVLFPCNYARAGLRSHTPTVTLALIGLFCIYNLQKSYSKRENGCYFLAWVFFSLAVCGDVLCIPMIILPFFLVNFIGAYRDFINYKNINIKYIKNCFISILSIVSGILIEKMYFILGTANKNSFLGSKRIINLDEFYNKIILNLQCILKLFNADFSGQELFSHNTFFCVMSSVIVICAFYVVIKNISCFAKGKEYDEISVCLGIGLLTVLCLCVMTNILIDLSGSRYFATAPGLLCIIVVRSYCRELQGMFFERKVKVLKLGMALLLVTVLVGNVLTIPAKAYRTDGVLFHLIDVLKQNKLTNGYSEFWTASATTVYAQNEMRIRALITDQGKLRQFKWFCKNDWYDEESHFVIANADGSGMFFKKSDVENTFGKPDKLLKCDRYLVYVYNRDISKTIKE